MSQKNTELDLFIGLGENESMPEINKTFEFVSGITDITYEVKIVKIKSMRWSPQNDGVIVTILGQKTPKKIVDVDVDGEDDEEEGADEE